MPGIYDNKAPEDWEILTDVASVMSYDHSIAYTYADAVRRNASTALITSTDSQVPPTKTQSDDDNTFPDLNDNDLMDLVRYLDIIDADTGSIVESFKPERRGRKEGVRDDGTVRWKRY